MPNFNVAIIGDPKVGKTSLVAALKLGQQIAYVPTTSCQITTIAVMTNQGRQQLTIWDCSGRFEDHVDRKVAYLNADLVVIMFDLTSKQGYEHWLKDLLAIGSKPVLICGNKMDLCQDSLQSEVEKPYHAISIKSNKNTNQLLNAILRRLTGHCNLIAIEPIIKCENRLCMSGRLKTAQDGVTQYGTFNYAD